MASRLKLQETLESLLGSRNVYYQPPENLKINYDAIVYSLSDIDVNHADDISYNKTRCYQLVIITRLPDPPVVAKLLDTLPYCGYDRQYVSDNLYHTVMTLYY